MLPLLAQAVSQTDPLGGWGTLILQGGAFSLLVYIVTVMYPRESKRAADERENRDRHFSELVDALQTRFEARNKEIVGAVQDQTRVLTEALKGVCRGDPRSKS